MPESGVGLVFRTEDRRGKVVLSQVELGRDEDTVCGMRDMRDRLVQVGPACDWAMSPDPRSDPSGLLTWTGEFTGRAEGTHAVFVLMARGTTVLFGWFQDRRSPGRSESREYLREIVDSFVWVDDLESMPVRRRRPSG